MGRQRVRLGDISRNREKRLLQMVPEDLMPFPSSWDQAVQTRPIQSKIERVDEVLLDGVSALGIVGPKSREEEEQWVERFLVGLRKLLSQRDNWTFWQPLVHSLESCVRCQICSDACHTYLSSGKQEIYRPTYRAEVLRRIINKYVKRGGEPGHSIDRGGD